MAKRGPPGARSISTLAPSRFYGRGGPIGVESSPFDPGDAEGYVFARPDGTPIHPHLLSDAFKKLVTRSGLPRIRLHDLRHTHATLLLTSGVPTKVVSERLGHATPGFTMATYQHVLPVMQAEAARTFAELLVSPFAEPLPASTR